MPNSTPIQPTTEQIVEAKQYIDIVFDGPPSHVTGRFVEVENAEGCSINFGEWVRRDDGYWALRIPDCAELVEALRQWREAKTSEQYIIMEEYTDKLLAKWRKKRYE